VTDENDANVPPAAAEATLFPKTVGERLREARLAQKLDLSDIAQRTRVPLRHLEAIENGDYSAMPTPTYAVGFAKAFARAVGEDEVEIAREVRGRSEVTAARRPEYVPYDTSDLPRGPSSGVMIGAIALALLLVVAGGLWFGTDLFRGSGLDAPAPVASESFAPEPAASATSAPAAAGQVTLVANDEVWVRIYDAAGQTLKQGTLAPGERYDVPADANNPMINVGRPDKLQVLVNGSAVAPLGDGKVAIKDVGISAAALSARGAAAPAPTATPTSAPSASLSARPSPSASRSVPPFFRPTPEPTRTSAASTSTGQRETPPAAAAAPAAAPSSAAPGNGTGG
jgi:transcriptional regulator with XRE-family HTH domain